MANQPTALIIGGPNGAGKSTLASLLLDGDIVFLNADEIAKSLRSESKQKDIEAGRLFLEQLDSLTRKGVDFAIETTLSSKSLATRIRAWKDLGYQVHLRFIWVPDVEMSIQRVAERVRAGGHDIPEYVIRRRYSAGWRNFHLIYKQLVHSWRVYANMEAIGPALVAEGDDSGEVTIYHQEIWQRFSQFER